MTNIFVGNLSYRTAQDELHSAFAEYGGVERVNIVTDRDTGQSRGFAFVEMRDAGEGGGRFGGRREGGGGGGARGGRGGDSSGGAQRW